MFVHLRSGQDISTRAQVVWSKTLLPPQQPLVRIAESSTKWSEPRRWRLGTEAKPPRVAPSLPAMLVRQSGFWGIIHEYGFWNHPTTCDERREPQEKHV